MWVQLDVPKANQASIPQLINCSFGFSPTSNRAIKTKYLWKSPLPLNHDQNNR
jgi:hypothetical protein